MSYGNPLLDIIANGPQVGLNAAASLAGVGIARGIWNSSSKNSTIKKKRSRVSTVPTKTDLVEPPLRLERLGKSPKVKSVWSSLRDLVTAQRRVSNSFSFKMSSLSDKRGLMAIPLRHDGVMANARVDNGWAVGIQGTHLTPSDDDFDAYTSMLHTVNADPVFTTGDTRGVIIPRLNLPTLEQISWDLNQLKLVQTDNGSQTVAFSDPGSATDRKSLLLPVQQLGGSSVALYGSTKDAQSIVEPWNSAARMQNNLFSGVLPYKGALQSLPKFKTQLTGGSLKMRVVNQGLDRCTVEYVVIRVTDPNISKQLEDQNTMTSTTSSQFRMENLWTTLLDTVGYEHARKVGLTAGFPMGLENQPSSATKTGNTGVDELKIAEEVLVNPYHSWLPSGLFKANYPTQKTRGTMGAEATSVEPNVSGATTTIPFGTSVTSTGTNLNEPKYVLNEALGSEDSPHTDQSTVEGSGGQRSAYRVAGRGHCTIGCGGERSVTIPLPGSLYDASRILSVNTNRRDEPGAPIVNEHSPGFSNQSYVVLMSVNGALTDMILDAKPGATNPDSIKVIGKAYAPTTVDVYCTYTENIAPVHCDYSQIPTQMFNMGQVRNPMLPGNTAAYPGRVLDANKIIPVSQNAVCRTGNTHRGGVN